MIAYTTTPTPGVPTWVQLLFLALGGGGFAVAIVQAWAARQPNAAGAVKTFAEGEVAEAEAGRIITDTAGNVVALVKGDNADLRDELAALRTELAAERLAARDRERALEGQISQLATRVTLAEARAQIAEELREELAERDATIRRLRADLAALGDARREPRTVTD